ncbi:F-box domain containing protein [Quillaja saponaria]|uniref:F-box domain containing protein n=1 Tax=Quillaja saponaria TaxID=32244 RepID=A0AAD7QFM9_QUISA|nr:F-box domain containing protein [Quillaja saponaria]
MIRFMAGVDRISDLPDHVIHHLMSLISTKDSTKFTALSKKFRYLWISFPVLDFDFSVFSTQTARDFDHHKFEKSQSFINYVRQSLQARQLVTSLQKLRFRFFVKTNRDFDWSETGIESLLDQLVDFSVKNNVQEFDLQLSIKYLDRDGDEEDEEPVHIKVKSNNFLEKLLSLESITILKLSGSSIDFMTENLIDISACNKSLRSLLLKGVKVSNTWLTQVDSGWFHMLEDLKFNRCEMPKSLNIANDKLKTLELNDCQGLDKVLVKEQADQLSRFNLFDCENLMEAEILAPNLFWFSYRCKLMMNPPIITSTKFVAEIKLCRKFISLDDAEWFYELRQFLGYFDHCKLLTLVCDVAQVVIFPRILILSEITPVMDMRQLKVILQKAPGNELLELVENLLWLVPHPETIAIVVGSKEKSIKFQYHPKPVDYKEDELCCWTRPLKCWRHHVKSILIENFGEADTKILGTYFEQNAIRLKKVSYN